MRLLLATTNRGKLREFADLFVGCGLDLVTPAEVNLTVSVAESGNSYAENARLKASAFAAVSQLVALADDSGLEVDALDGAPGLHSARYAGEGASDTNRVRKLLDNLYGVPQEKRKACFRCVIAVAIPEGEVRLTEGRCEGFIAFEPRGENGFGYDPVFVFPEYNMTMAELPAAVKNRISHRARAAEAARPWLLKLSQERSHAGTS